MALHDNLISSWGLNESSGITAEDNYGSNDLTNYGTATIDVSGKVDTCYDFNGSTDYLKIATQVIPVGDYSFSVWVNLDATGDQNILDQVSSAAYNTMCQLRLISGYMRFFISLSGGSISATSTTQLVPGTWYHYIGTFNNTTKELKLYEDAGTPVTDTGSGTMINTQNNGFAIASSSKGEPSLPVNGKIDAVQIWSRVLSADEVSTLFNGGDGLEYPFEHPLDGVNLSVEIDGDEVDDIKQLTINRSQNKFNTTSSFEISLDNTFGRLSGKYSTDQEIKVYADLDAMPTTTIFNGIIEDINYYGVGQRERITLFGRDYGSILQDIIVSPRIFKDTETSEIVNNIMSQNISSITTNNVNVTTTTVEKITFTNVSVYDALVQLAEISGFYFYVDIDKDLHFEPKDSISSGITLDNTNVLSGRFKISEQDKYTKVTVIGDRQLTGAESIQTTGTDNTGSVYTMDSKPYNTSVIISGATNTFLQPGGIYNISDPATENSKFLIDFQNSKVILTSGTTAGDNVQSNGTVIIFNYQRSTPIVSVKQNLSNYPKHKQITDRNIKSIEEASTKATSFLTENSYDTLEGSADLKGILDLTPGNTVNVNLPNHNQNNQTYSIMNIKYEFNPINNLNSSVISVKLNKKISNFVDIMKEQILRLRSLESSESDSSITNVELGSSIVGVRNTNEAILTSIGSAFYFHVPNHNILNSPSSLLGDMRTGSIVFQNGVQI